MPLSDSGPLVLSAAAQALGQLRDPSTVPPLVELFDSKPVPSPTLVDTLAAFGADALDALTEPLGSPRPAARLDSVEIPCRIGGASPTELGPRCAELVAPLVDADDYDLRLTALLALGEIGPSGRLGIERAQAHEDLASVARRLLANLHVT